MIPTNAKLSDLKIKSDVGEKDLYRTDPIFFELLETRSVMSTEDTSKIDSVQKNYAGIKDIELVEESRDNTNTRGRPEKDHDWTTIKDAHSAITILESYADEQKRSILNALAGKSLNWKEIVKICHI